jgi:hypothetical protein
LTGRNSFIGGFQTVIHTKPLSMKQTFTQEQLLQLIYKETSLAESLEMEEALDRDPQLQEEYNELLEAFRELPKVSFQPSAQTISSILSYSEQATLEALQ